MAYIIIFIVTVCGCAALVFIGAWLMLSILNDMDDEKMIEFVRNKIHE